MKEMCSIVVGGMIGLGKTSVSELLGQSLSIPIYYEKVEGNMVLERFYTASKEEQEQERLTFLLQLEFLTSRFKAIKENIHKKRGILDRSIFEDVYFAKRNMEFGNLIGENRITKLEFKIYSDLFDQMMEETEDYRNLYGSKAPDVMIYLRGSFDTVLDRIALRGREFEQNQSLVDYYRFLWQGYDDWVYNQYNASEVITLDMDALDVVNRQQDADYVVRAVKQHLQKQETLRLVL